METWAGLCPGLHLYLGIWLLIAAHTLQKARAEISCASCPSPVQLHLEELQLGARPDPTGDPTGDPGTLSSIRVEFRELGVTEQNAGEDDGVSVGDVPRFAQDASLDGVSAKGDAQGSSGESLRSGDYAREPGEPVEGEGAALRRAKRNGPEFAEFGENGWTGRSGVDGGAPEDRGSLLDGHKQSRSEFRWNREDGRGNNRQDEPKLTGSTFALTGDSAHNHAVVYWSGQNSSVSTHQFFFFSLPPSPLLPLSAHSVAFHIHIAHGGCVDKLRVRDARSGHRALRRAAELRLAVNRCTGSSRCASTHTHCPPQYQICASTVNRIRPLALPAVTHPHTPPLARLCHSCVLTSIFSLW